MRQYFLLIIASIAISCSEIAETIQPNTYTLPKDTEQLEHLLVSEKSSAMQLEIYWKLYKGYRGTNPEKALSYLEELATLSSSVQNQTFEGLSYQGIGRIYRTQGIYDKSINAHLKAIHIFDKNNDPSRLADNYSSIGTTFMHVKGYRHAISYLDKSVHYYKTANDHKYLVSAYANLSNCHAKLSTPDYDQAHNVLKTAIEIQKAFAPNDNRRLSRLYSKSGIIAFEKGDYEDAINSYQDALSYAFKSNAIELQADISYNIAEAYSYWGQYKEAHQWLIKAENLPTTQTQNSLKAIMRYNIKGELHQYQGKHGQAIAVLDKAVKIANQKIINPPLHPTGRANFRRSV